MSTLGLLMFCPLCPWYLVFVPVCYACFFQKIIKIQKTRLVIQIYANFVSIRPKNRFAFTFASSCAFAFARICQISVNFAENGANSHYHSKVPLRAVHEGYIAH